MRLEDAITYVDGNYGPSTGQLLNIIFKSILHFVAVLACLIPMQLFYRSGELAGATLVATGAVMNFYHFTNTLLWHNDDIANWPKGYGWCDIQLAMAVPLETLVAASTCAILRNVANQIYSLRATTLTGNEKRRKNITHALIIFPVPLLQGVLYFFVIGGRYNISGIIGCQAVFQTNWVFVVFFLLPCPIFSLCAGYYAVFSWWRYRQIDAESRESLWNSRDTTTQTRNARARRKLYFMTLTIIAPWLPLQLVFLYDNIRAGMPWDGPFDLASVHPEGWNQIDYSPISTVRWSHMFGIYSYALEALIVFLYFGLTKDAHDLYRDYLRALGLAKFFPKLNEEYFPSDRPRASLSSMWSRARKASNFALSTQATQSFSGPSGNKTGISTRQIQEVDDIQPLDIRLNSFDLEAARSVTDTARSSEQMPQLPMRNPWALRITPASPLNMGTFFGGKKVTRLSNSSSLDPLQPVIHPLHTTQAPSALGKYHAGPSSGAAHGAGWSPTPSDGRVHTRVWAMDRRGTSAVDGTSLGNKEMDEGVVRVERHFSSSSEVSPPKPTYR